MADRVRLVLASGSPRRRDLLTSAGVTFDIASADIDETPAPGETGTALVERLALAKARRVSESAIVLDRADPEAAVVVLGSDTVVELEGEVLGKPADPREAREMLAQLSGVTHQVHTGVALVMVAPRESGAAIPKTAVAMTVETTDVTFVELRPESIERYVASGDPLDKAGAYGMQSGAGRFVSQIVGNPQTVVGLPMAAVDRLLTDLDLSLDALIRS